jgi:ribosomal protein L37AE/L43A
MMDGTADMNTRTASAATPGVPAGAGRTCPQCGAPVDIPKHAGVAVCASCGSTLVLDDFQQAPEGPPAAGPDQAVLHSVECPQCAGPLGVREGRRILVCGHCGVRVAVKERDGFSRWYFPGRVDRLKAVGAGSAWLEQHPGIAKRARNAHFVEAQLAWAPIWEYKALVVGWEFGSRFRTQNELVGEEDNERLELRLVRERVEEPHLRERRFFQAATDLAALGATRPRITGREPALPLLAGELDASALILEAEGTAAEMIEKGRRAVLQPLSGALSPDVHLFALRESTTLLFYPLWLLRYQDGNRSYRMVVNGRDGTVNSATAPADIGEQVVRLIVTVASMVVAVAFLVWLGIERGAVRAPTLVAAVIVSVVALLMVWRFRAQREVEYHEPFSS